MAGRCATELDKPYTPQDYITPRLLLVNGVVGAIFTHEIFQQDRTNYRNIRVTGRFAKAE